MVWDLLKIITPVLLTAYLGARLAQHWQMRSWILQQKVNDRDQRYSELKTLYDDLDRIANRRLYRLRLLIWALKKADKDKIEERITSYAEVVTEWNEKFNSIVIRSVRILESGSYLIWSFEQMVSKPLLEIGSIAEGATRNFRATGSTNVSNSQWVQHEKNLDSLNYHLIDHMRNIYIELQKLKEERFFIIEDGRLNREFTDLSKVSSIHLIKAIFQQRY
jgi:hypothetical protein